jgi:hypothetical protein
MNAHRVVEFEWRQMLATLSNLHVLGADEICESNEVFLPMASYGRNRRTRFR